MVKIRLRNSIIGADYFRKFRSKVLQNRTINTRMGGKYPHRVMKLLNCGWTLTRSDALNLKP